LLKQKSSVNVLENKITNKPVLWPWLIVLVILTLVPYAQMASHEFINWDDPFYISDNSIVSAGLSWLGVGWAFITNTASNWHPLTWISHMLDSSLFGATATASHMVNLFWYAGCVILVFFLFLKLKASVPAAFFMTAFFALHPLHVESVAWAAERKDLLCAFFFLSATLSYLNYAGKNGKNSLYYLTTFFFVLSLLSKPMAITWPCVALLLDFWPLKRFGSELKKAIYEKIPWFALSIITSIITVIAQDKSRAIKSLVEFPLTERLANAVISYLEYIHQSLLPFELTVFYPYPYAFDYSSVIMACAVLILITVVAVWQRDQRPHLLWGWLFYLGVLFPVIGIVQVGEQAHADRYMLLPQLGLILMAGFSLDKVMKEIKIRRLAAVVIILFVAVLMVLTFRQVSYWKNTKTLFSQNLVVAGENELAHFNLGTAYLQSNQFKLAITHLLAAAKMNPADITTFNNLGVAYAGMNQDNLAESCFRQVILLDPKIAQPYFHLAELRVKQGLLMEAMKYIDKAMQLAPQWGEVNDLRDQVQKLLSEKSTS
jgi:tetratricopeptide (TPR) repeat protein